MQGTARSFNNSPALPASPLEPDINCKRDSSSSPLYDYIYIVCILDSLVVTSLPFFPSMQSYLPRSSSICSIRFYRVVLMSIDLCACAYQNEVDISLLTKTRWHSPNSTIWPLNSIKTISLTQTGPSAYSSHL